MAQDELNRLRKLRSETEKNTIASFALYDAKIQGLERAEADEKAEVVNKKVLRYTIISAVSAILAAILAFISIVLTIFSYYHPHP